MFGRRRMSGVLRTPCTLWSMRVETSSIGATFMQNKMGDWYVLGRLLEGWTMRFWEINLSHSVTALKIRYYIAWPSLPSWHWPQTKPGQLRSGSIRNLPRSWSGPPSPLPNRKYVKGVESSCFPKITSREDLHGRVGQNPCSSVCKENLVKN